MAGGELRGIVAWEYRMAVNDRLGDPNSGPWAEAFRCSARLTPLVGSEAVIASRLQGVQPYLIRVRVSSQTRQITTEWRARNARTGVEMAIKTISNRDEKGQFLDIMAVEGIAA
ncbi:MAG: head-tail adaptor protein [Xanthobacteraceae bacterium]